jgi:hypothetical protein
MVVTLEGRLLALPANIRAGWKDFPAYLGFISDRKVLQHWHLAVDAVAAAVVVESAKPPAFLSRPSSWCSLSR